MPTLRPHVDARGRSHCAQPDGVANWSSCVSVTALRQTGGCATCSLLASSSLPGSASPCTALGGSMMGTDSSVSRPLSAADCSGAQLLHDTASAACACAGTRDK
eukprot:5313835-Pleurochrysis_carterae.AAC.2